MNKIPRTFLETEKLTNETVDALQLADHLYFEPSDGEVIEVSEWSIYPSYDFIIGYPIPESPRYVKEVACLVVRYKNGKQYATYLDKQELEDVLNGLIRIYEKVRFKK
jgi:hypothetical protein